MKHGGIASDDLRVADGIWRLGTSYINWYLIRDGDAFTLVDTGLPRYWPQLLGLLTSLDAGVDQIAAIVITHHHPDHRGNISRASRTVPKPPLAHRADAPFLKGEERLRVRGLYRFLWRPWYLGYFVHLLKNGVASAETASEVTHVGDGDELDIPGHPRVVYVPGHTPGSCALHLEDKSVLISGDALVTLDTSTGFRGPSIIRGPVTHDADLAMRSLERIEETSAETVLPGHGEPWREGIAVAVRCARERYAQ